jgi:hypothetical protein
MKKMVMRISSIIIVLFLGVNLSFAQSKLNDIKVKISRGFTPYLNDKVIRYENAIEDLYQCNCPGNNAIVTVLEITIIEANEVDKKITVEGEMSYLEKFVNSECKTVENLYPSKVNSIEFIANFKEILGELELIEIVSKTVFLNKPEKVYYPFKW